MAAPPPSKIPVEFRAHAGPVAAAATATAAHPRFGVVGGAAAVVTGLPQDFDARTVVEVAIDIKLLLSGSFSVALGGEGGRSPHRKDPEGGAVPPMIPDERKWEGPMGNGAASAVETDSVAKAVIDPPPGIEPASSD